MSPDRPSDTESNSDILLTSIAFRVDPSLVLWAQRSNVVFVTVNIPDATAPVTNLTEDKLEFTATSDNKHYAVVIEFNQAIDPETSITKSSPRNFFFTLKKKEEKWWSRLTKGPKPNFIKTDFARWKDEDDEDDEVDESSGMDMGGLGMPGMPGASMGGGMGGMGDMDFQKLMASMGQGGQGMPDFGDEQEGDSDDDDVPALEETEATTEANVFPSKSERGYNFSVDVNTRIYANVG
ncbi:hypothetical protein BGZ80_000392 [Entomortierella chlamydospora]|uniref:CS domain-containing protein n=1 Tax=Entomortierella chlamydospora TaxID=101097 RepID=A0A9P6N3F4_9FUNG|nr:hypothetical protein BGZ79_005312 [Entomortierella chlamydospora]KAG0022369.1 hypothetical protein BGZ80_000392 [Entomortierella chlamydospora]